MAKASMRGQLVRIIWIVIGAIVLVYALQGGEYSTTALLAQRSRAKRMKAGMDSLRREIDSLARVKKAVEGDPAVQERIAREEFGMVRGNKEILYRFAEPDTGRKP